MDNVIITDFKNPRFENINNLIFLNNNDECIICSQNIEETNLLILINNLCKCYNATKICKECFFTWIL